jgi:hypothetical protein
VGFNLGPRWGQNAWSSGFGSSATAPQVLINALTGHVKFGQIHLSGNATNQELGLFTTLRAN